MSDIIRTEGGNTPPDLTMPLDYYEPRIVEMASQSVRVFEALGGTPPVFVLLSLVGVKGAYGLSSRRRDWFAYPFDRDIVMAPEVMIESFTAPLAVGIRPALDTLWNAAGYRGSPNFTTTGTYRPQ